MAYSKVSIHGATIGGRTRDLILRLHLFFDIARKGLDCILGISHCDVASLVSRSGEFS